MDGIWERNVLTQPEQRFQISRLWVKAIIESIPVAMVQRQTKDSMARFVSSTLFVSELAGGSDFFHFLRLGMAVVQKWYEKPPMSCFCPAKPVSILKRGAYVSMISPGAGARLVDIGTHLPPLVSTGTNRTNFFTGLQIKSGHRCRTLVCFPYNVIVVAPNFDASEKRSYSV